jgi:aryl-alcohol dehydrogenase-like predicted oxidoreductase
MPESSKAVIDKVAEIAKAKGISMAQVALAWSLSKPFITAPIVGTTSLDKLEDLIKGCSVELSDEEIKAIDGLYEPLSIIGHR